MPNETLFDYDQVPARKLTVSVIRPRIYHLKMTSTIDNQYEAVLEIEHLRQTSYLLLSAPNKNCNDSPKTSLCGPGYCLPIK